MIFSNLCVLGEMVIILILSDLGQNCMFKILLCCRLSLGKLLGEGAFGIVVQAEAMGICVKNVHTTVAVKMLKGNERKNVS